MRYIYHSVPPAMVGTVLRPLNQLRLTLPEVYQREAAKYNDHPSRLKLLKTRLAGLECLWNDVIHCSSIHPHLLYEEWTRHIDRPDSDLRFFAIPIIAVSHLSLAIMHTATGGERRNLSLITADQYEEGTVIPEETRAWYEKLASEGRFGGHFVGVPHILVRGSIGTSGVREIRWSDPITGR